MRLENREKLFLEKNPDKPFLVYKKIIGRRASITFETLCSNFDVEAFKENIDAINQVVSKGKFLKVIDESTFSLNEYFEHIPTKIPDTVFLNYGDMSEFYEVSTESLNFFFDDVYFPGADDIEIFDASCSWLFSINHDNYLLLCKSLPLGFTALLSHNIEK